MVERQLRRRGIADERVLEAMGAVPREAFVPERERSARLHDGALPIGEADDLPAVGRRGDLPRRSRSTGPSGCSRSGPARATRRRCSPGSAREVVTRRAVPDARRSAPAGDSRELGVRNVSTSGRRQRAARPTRALRRDRRPRRRRRRRRHRLPRSSRRRPAGRADRPRRRRHADGVPRPTTASRSSDTHRPVPLRSPPPRRG